MKKIIVLLTYILFCHTGFSQANVDQNSKILIVLSNATHYGTSDITTANHFAETVVPFDVFVSAGYDVDFVSPKGGRVPIGYINTADTIIAKYIHDHDFMDKILNTKRPQEVITKEYAAIFYSGGGAAMFGVPEDKLIQDIAMAIYEENIGVVAAICHGTAGLVNLKTSDGQYLVSDKKINGFPDIFENKEAAYYQEFPFSIQEKIESRDGDFVYAEEWDAQHYIIDGRLATGQDPSSAKVLAQQIVKMLSPNTP